MLRYVSIPFVWRPIQDRDGEMIGKRVQRVLESWEGTPYVLGACQKQRGVDCVRFVASVIDELYGRRRADQIATLPPDAALHDRAGAIGAMKRILELYPCDPVEDSFIEPGDVFVTGAANGGPGHAMIAGNRQGELWHASSEKVCRTGTAFTTTGLMKLHRVYRGRDRFLWAFVL